jgi:hypothetical protein
MRNTLHVDIKDIEQALVEDKPYGCSRFILSRTYTFYQFAIELLTERSSHLLHFCEALREADPQNRQIVLSNPVFRTTINEAIARIIGNSLTDWQQVEDVARAMLPTLHSSDYRDPLAAEIADSPRIDYSGVASSIWVWNTNHPTHVLDRRFASLFQRELALSGLKSPAALRAPDAQMLHTLIQGVQLLGDLLPDLTCSLLDHLRIIAIVDFDRASSDYDPSHGGLFESASYDAIPGAIFLSPSSLNNPWSAAEVILHEAAHQKLNDIRLTHSIFRSGYSAEESPKIHAVWNKSLAGNSNQWPVDRAIGAYHVYVHLSLFFSTVEQKRGELELLYGPANDIDPDTRTHIAYERALYLGHELKRHAQKDLQADGYRLVDWLLAILDASYGYDK